MTKRRCAPSRAMRRGSRRSCGRAKCSRSARERKDYLQVWDYRRERGGYVRANQVRRTRLAAAEAPGLLAVLRFLSDTPGAEALGIGYAAAFMRAAPAEVLNGDDGVEALDALGSFADRLAQRASSGAQLSRSAQAALAAHLDVAAGYGVRFVNYERDGRSQLCYDGDAFRRVLAMRSTPEQRARAALALTRQECIAPELQPLARARLDEWRAEVLDQVEAARLARLPEEPRADAPRRGVEQPRLRARAPGRARRQRRGARDRRTGRYRQDRTRRCGPRGLRRCGHARERLALGRDTGAGADGVPRRAHRHRAGRARRDLCHPGRREQRRRGAAGQALHLQPGLGRIGHAQSRRHGAGAGGATAGRMARAVAVPQGSARLGGARAAAVGARLPRSAMPSSPAGCPAAGRCWWRAKPASRGSTSAASS